jgi:hypothetical protein
MHKDYRRSRSAFNVMKFDAMIDDHFSYRQSHFWRCLPRKMRRERGNNQQQSTNGPV